MTLKEKKVGRYIIRSNGTIYSLKRNRELVPSLGNHGYLVVNIGNGTQLLHRIIGEYFLNNEGDLPCINHKDGDKKNNNIDNLEWCSYSDNMKHAIENGLWNGNYKRPGRRKAVTAVKGVESFNFNSIGEASDSLGILRTAISNCLTGLSNTAGGYRWHYL